MRAPLSKPHKHVPLNPNWMYHQLHFPLSAYHKRPADTPPPLNTRETGEKWQGSQPRWLKYLTQICNLVSEMLASSWALEKSPGKWVHLELQPQELHPDLPLARVSGIRDGRDQAASAIQEDLDRGEAAGVGWMWEVGGPGGKHLNTWWVSGCGRWESDSIKHKSQCSRLDREEDGVLPTGTKRLEGWDFYIPLQGRALLN